MNKQTKQTTKKTEQLLENKNQVNLYHGKYVDPTYQEFNKIQQLSKTSTRYLGTMCT